MPLMLRRRGDDAYDASAPSLDRGDSAYGSKSLHGDVRCASASGSPQASSRSPHACHSPALALVFPETRSVSVRPLGTIAIDRAFDYE